MTLKLSNQPGSILYFLASQMLELQKTLPDLTEDGALNLLKNNVKEMQLIPEEVDVMYKMFSKTPGYVKLILDLCLMPIWQNLGKTHIDNITRNGRSIVSFIFYFYYFY